MHPRTKYNITGWPTGKTPQSVPTEGFENPASEWLRFENPKQTRLSPAISRIGNRQNPTKPA